MPAPRTSRDVDPRPLLHPLHDAFGLGNRGIGRLPQGLPTLPQGFGFASIAQGMGVASQRVTQPEDIEAAVKAALAADAPYVLEMVTEGRVPAQ
jgi:hypothetical protein